MVLLEETSSHYTFGCPPCRDINKVLSIQVRTKALFRKHIQQQVLYKRASSVQRDGRGRITYFT
jgi:hypothetical protein